MQPRSYDDMPLDYYVSEDCGEVSCDFMISQMLKNQKR